MSGFSVTNQPDGTGVLLYDGEPIGTIKLTRVGENESLAFQVAGLRVKGPDLLDPRIRDTNVGVTGATYMTPSAYNNWRAQL